MEDNIEETLNAKLEYFSKVLTLLKHFLTNTNELEFRSCFLVFLEELRQNKMLQAQIRKTLFEKKQIEDNEEQKKTRFKDVYSNMFNLTGLVKSMTCFGIQKEARYLKQAIEKELKERTTAYIHKAKLNKKIKESNPIFNISQFPLSKVTKKHRKSNSLQINNDLRFVTMYLEKDKNAKILNFQTTFKDKNANKLPKVLTYLTNTKIKIQIKKTLTKMQLRKITFH